MKWVHFIKFFSSISRKENTYCMSHLYKTSFNSEHTDTHLHKCLLSETHPHTLIHREQLNNSCRTKSDYLVPQFPFSLVFSFNFFRSYHKKGVLQLYCASLLKWMFIRLKCLFLISNALLLLSQREQKKREINTNTNNLYCT